MLKRYPIALGFLIASALWAVYLVLQSDASAYHQICETNQYSGKESCSPHHIPYVISWYVGYWFDKASPVITALATAAVAWFTWTLWQSSEKMWIATKESADAANLSARAAVARESAIIRCQPFGFGAGSAVGNGVPIKYNCYISGLNFVNAGSTKAFPIEIQCGWTLDSALPQEPVFTYKKSFPIDAIFECDRKGFEFYLHGFVFERREPFMSDLRSPYNEQPKVSLWLYCELAYLDFMDERRTKRFCWKRFETFAKGGFTPDPTPAYNRKS